MAPDAITLEIIGTRLREIGSTMEHLLFHTGYFTTLRESHDGLASITDAEGNSVETTGAPISLLPYKMTIQSLLKSYPLEAMNDGDCFISNDPYGGGTLHIPDVLIITPIFIEGEIIGFCCSTAHKPDMGGLVPGSSGAAAREVFHEGLMLPEVKYWTKDGVVAEVSAIIERNCRIPQVIAGNLRPGRLHPGRRAARPQAMRRIWERGHQGSFLRTARLLVEAPARAPAGLAGRDVRGRDLCRQRRR